MAEIASAAVALASIVQKLSEIAYSEINTLRGVADGVERLNKELSWMQSFLKDAEKKLDDDSNSVRNWVSSVRDLAFEAEDVIDTFLLKQEPESSSSCQCISFFKNGPIARELEKLSAKALDISKWREQYGLISTGVRNNSTSNSEERLRKLRELKSYADNDFIVGLVNEASTLKEKLKNGGTKRCVISILGMGGLGKTTLARKLYTELKDEYPCHAWVCVSQEYETKEILQRLIKSTLNPDQKELEGLTSEDSMERFLREGLKKKTFLIVIDDLWSKEAWRSIERVFPNEETSSRIIVTTRIEDVAKVTNGFILSQRTLDESDSWDLFCRKAFPNDACFSGPSMLRKYGKQMLDLGQQMVAKCSGLPLAIVTLGALLSTRSQEIDEWKVVKENLWKELGKEETQINAILSLSFKYLPDHLKLCLLYVGMFPEDYEISVRDLMHMWEAEGFIEQDEEANAERITKSYFNELVGRSLLIKKDTEDWIDKLHCGVHDLVRDLVMKNAKEIRYSTFYDENQCFDVKKAQSQRRLAIYRVERVPINYTNRSLRTLFFEKWRDEIDNNHEFLKSLYLRFPLLRVLRIKIPTTKPGPDLQMDKLLNLRYLSLWISGPIELPETLGDLKYLQTLEVWSDHVFSVKLPKTVVKLQNLKRLIGNLKTCGCRIGELIALETLHLSYIEDWLEVDTTKLGNLRDLYLRNKSDWGIRGAETPTSFSQKFNDLERLQTLTLIGKFPCKISEIFEVCPYITDIAFQSDFDTVDFGEFASNLQVVEVTMLNGENFRDLMTSLENLPNLRALKFFITTNQHLEYTCSQGGFSQLRTLSIIIHESTENVIGDITLVGGMPLLTNLTVYPRNKLLRLERPEQSTTEEP